MRPLFVLSVFLLSVSAANAQGYSVTLGPGALFAPPYEGAKHIEVGPLPWINITTAGRERGPAAPDDSLGIELYSGAVGIGIVGALRGSRNTRGERAGLRPVDSAFELGAAFDVWPADWLRTRIEVKHGLSGHEGWVADVGADAFLTEGALTYVAGPRLGFGSEAYMDKYFGVTPAEAAANLFVKSSFSPEAGLRYVGAAAGIIHRHGNWQEVAGLTWHRMAGEAANSPMISKVGAADQLIVTLGIMYTFGVGD